MKVGELLKLIPTETVTWVVGASSITEICFFPWSGVLSDYISG
jgi:hypothetical protein